MKKVLLIILVLFLIGFFVLANTDFHLKRNQYNIIPSGKLTHESGSVYRDENNNTWILQSNFKNALHQPDSVVRQPKNPYPNIVGELAFDSEYPNKKFLMVHENGSSSEVIVQVNGIYLSTGPKQGTYNYYHPEGIWGMTMHTVVDVIPHFINCNYE